MESLLPELRVARAAALANELMGRFASYRAGGWLGTVVEAADDRRSLTTRLRVTGPPPVGEWSVILGDFLHDLRSGLDALAWELCHVDDAKPLRDDKVQFPIFGSHKRWSAEKKWLESMPAVNLERIEQLQPFRQVSTSHQTLDVLSYLNNVDKHRGLVTTSADVRVVGMSLRGLSFGEGVSMPEVSLEQLVDGPVPIEDGLEILRTNFGAAFSGEPYDAHGTATVNVMVRFGGGHVEPIGEVMRQLLEGTTAVVEFVRRGADD